jgi:hypothetical protein
VLVAIKPHTLDFETADFAALEANLARLNHLLDKVLSSRNGKRRTKPEGIADELDREGQRPLFDWFRELTVGFLGAGVHLWNVSILLRVVQDHGDSECRKRVFAGRKSYLAD